MQEQPIRERSNSIRSHDSAQSVAERTLHRSGSVTGHYSRGQGCDAVRRDGIATTGAKVHDPEENGGQGCDAVRRDGRASTWEEAPARSGLQ